MKYLVGFFLVFSFVELSAQTEQNFIITTNTGYSYAKKAHVENVPGWVAYMYDKEINDLKFSFAIGRKLRSNMYYGLGVVFNVRNDERNPEVDEPRYDSGIGMYFETSNSVYTRTVYGPMAYLQYNLSISERSHFVLNLISRYDFEKCSDEHNRFMPNLPNSDDFTIYKTTSESDRQYFSLGIEPGFRMNIYRSFGIDFTVGSLAYRIKTAESILPDYKESREFKIDFTPENWMVGFHFSF